MSSGFGEDDRGTLGGEKVYAADVFVLYNCVDGDLKRCSWEQHLLASEVVDHEVVVAFRAQ